MKKLYKILYELYKLEPELVVTGSLSLYWHGMLNRQPSDLDLLVPTLETYLKDIDSPDMDILKSINAISKKPINKTIMNDSLIKYLESQKKTEDKSNESCTADAILGSEIEEVNIDFFNKDVQDSELLVKILTVQDTQFEVLYTDWNYVVPYKIKYYSGNVKHLKDIQYVKDRLEEFEGTEDAYQISIPGTKDHKVYNKINEFLDDVYEDELRLNKKIKDLIDSTPSSEKLNLPF